MREYYADKKTIEIGKVGENLATKVYFPNKEGYRATLSIQRRDDDVPYPKLVVQEGDYLVWEVDSTDVAVKGRGSAEVTYFKGEEIVKSITYTFNVVQSLEPDGDAPEPWESHYSDVLKASADAVESAEAAARESKKAEFYKDAAKGYYEETKEIADGFNVQELWGEIDYLEAEKADRNDVYTKEETDAKIAQATPSDYELVKVRVTNLENNKADKNDVYNRAEVDRKIADVPTYDDSEIREEIEKKADSSNVYTRGQVDAKITETDAEVAKKADKSAIYTKQEVDGLVADAEYDDTELKAEIAKKADASATATKEDLSTLDNSKLTKPTSGIAVGKYFRVASIDALGNPVLEAVDLPLSDYVKNTDYAGQGVAGVITGESSYAFVVNQSNGKPQAQMKSASAYGGLSNNAFIGKGTLENIGDDYVARHTKEKEWVLKGTIVGNEADRGNIDVGCVVDLVGCTELLIQGRTLGTGDSVMNYKPGSNALFSGISRNGSRTIRAHIETLKDGYEGKVKYLDSLTATYVSSSANVYEFLNKKVEEITTLYPSNPSVIRECNIEIWAR